MTTREEMLYALQAVGLDPVATLNEALAAYDEIEPEADDFAAGWLAATIFVARQTHTHCAFCGGPTQRLDRVRDRETDEEHAVPLCLDCRCDPESLGWRDVEPVDLMMEDAGL